LKAEAVDMAYDTHRFPVRKETEEKAQTQKEQELRTGGSVCEF
jgi:hypothetical protein